MAQKKNNPLKGKRHSNINGAKKLDTSYQVGEIFFPTKRGTVQGGKRRKPKLHTAIPEDIATKKKIKWSENNQKRNR